MSGLSNELKAYLRLGLCCALVFGLAAISTLAAIPTEESQSLQKVIIIDDGGGGGPGPDPRATTGEWITLPYLLQEPSGAAFSAAHSALLHNGRVLFLPESDTVKTLLWDPTNEASPTFSFPDNFPSDFLFCSGHSFLQSGQLLVVGGGGNFVSNAINRAWRYNPDAGTNGTWTRTAGDMLQQRWYPTAVTLGEPGFVLVASGVFGNVQYADQLEVYNETTDSFTVVTGGTRVIPETYPGLHLLPTGKVLYTNTGFGHFTHETNTTAAYFTFDNLENPVSGQWTTMTSPMNHPDRSEGMSLQILTPAAIPEEYTSRVVVFGGGWPNTAGRQKVEAISTAALSPSTPWNLLQDMAVPRFHASAVLLPDGKALVLGGAEHSDNGTTATKNTQIFNPATETFTTADNLEFSRGYHTVTVLLPSGKVMVSGGINGPNERKIEIFSPPYLFKGARPTITSVPTFFHHSQSITITTPNASSIQKVVLVRPMAYTHHTETEQRVLPLAFSQVDWQTLAVTAPGNHPHPQAPRGYYMLFILNSSGVPSQGQFVYLH